MSCEELILKLGTEGGSVSIWSLRPEGSSQPFVIKRNEADLEDLLSEEDTAEMNLSGDLGTAPNFHEALRILGRYPWYRFYPLHVHPNFLGAVLNEVTRLGGPKQAERWKEILLLDEHPG